MGSKKVDWSSCMMCINNNEMSRAAYESPGIDGCATSSLLLSSSMFPANTATNVSYTKFK